MKVLSKITTILVTILSCCSCSKPKAVTEEVFIDKVSQIKRDVSFDKANVEEIFIKESGDEFAIEQINEEVSATYAKNQSDKWVKTTDGYENAHDNNISYCLEAYQLNDRLYFKEGNSFGGDEIEEEYFLKPFAYSRIRTSLTRNEEYGGLIVTIYTDYFEWNEYGYLTYYLSTARSHYNQKHGGYLYFYKDEMKVTY